MGHLINPLSYRIYHLRYFNNNWFANFNYSILINQDILIQLLFHRLFYILKLDENGLIFANLKILRSFNNISLYLYVHDSFVDVMFANLKQINGYSNLKCKLQKKGFENIKFDLLTVNDFEIRALMFDRLKSYWLLNLLRYFFYLFFSNKLLRGYWNIIKTIFFYNLRKLNLNKFFNCCVYVVNLSKMNITASMISEFFYIRLKQYYTIWEVLKNVNLLFHTLQRLKILKGYKIMFLGRFSRKQRATYSWESVGSISASSIKARLDFKYSNIALKYGSCTIKIWLGLAKFQPVIDFII